MGYVTLLRHSLSLPYNYFIITKRQCPTSVDLSPGVPGIIHGVDVDTSYFTGNFAPRFSMQAACLDSCKYNYSNAPLYMLL